VSYTEDQAIALIMSYESHALAAGFEPEVKTVWVSNGPQSADQNDQENSSSDGSGEAGGAEQSSSEAITGNTGDLPGSTAADADLPGFNRSPVSPVRGKASFAPALAAPAFHR
jgi:hypothetical protein